MLIIWRPRYIVDTNVVFCMQVIYSYQIRNSTHTSSWAMCMRLKLNQSSNYTRTSLLVSKLLNSITYRHLCRQSMLQYVVTLVVLNFFQNTKVCTSFKLEIVQYTSYVYTVQSDMSWACTCSFISFLKSHVVPSTTFIREISWPQGITPYLLTRVGKHHKF